MERERLAADIAQILCTTPLNDMVRTDETTGAGPALNIKGAPVTIPKFSGYQDRHSPQDFLEKYSDIGGVSKQWWRFSDGNPDWQSFASDFTAEFTTVDYKFKLKAELDQVAQHPAKNLKQFIHVIAEYFDSIAEPVSDAEKVERVRRQMHPTFQDLTASMSFANLQEMVKASSPIMERAWHHLRYVPLPPPRIAQTAADLAFVYSSLHTIATPNQTLPAQQRESQLKPAAVSASKCPWSMTLLAGAPEWNPSPVPFARTPNTRAANLCARHRPSQVKRVQHAPGASTRQHESSLGVAMVNDVGVKWCSRRQGRGRQATLNDSTGAGWRRSGRAGAAAAGSGCLVSATVGTTRMTGSGRGCETPLRLESRDFGVSPSAGSASRDNCSQPSSSDLSERSPEGPNGKSAEGEDGQCRAGTKVAAAASLSLACRCRGL
ncbi:hypothetical protein HPB49_025888 [Dermacentor silvarum]|nr:hypothetical protein HPB49_025888 [Dermacentor silvarum]